MWKIASKDLMDPNFIRVKYVRYADDFVVSFIAPRSMAVEVRDQLRVFLNLGLNSRNLRRPSPTSIKELNF
jgi:hypothetical protein